MIAASVTVRAIGPAVSWLDAMGMMPVRLARPTVGLMPTSEFWLDGLRIDPDVSVAMVAGAKVAAAAAPGPALDPPGERMGCPVSGLRRGSYGLATKSPSARYPAGIARAR